MIIFDFPQTLSLGRVGYRTTVRKLSLISLRLCHLVVLVMGRPWGNYNDNFPLQICNLNSQTFLKHAYDPG
jgi:hypothetical protein